MCLAIAFGVCNFKKASNAAAVLEWAVAFIFTFYILSFYVDLFPAVRTRHAGGAGFKSHDANIRHAADRQMEEAGSDRYLNGPLDGPMDRRRDHQQANGYANGYANGNLGPHNNF